VLDFEFKTLMTFVRFQIHIFCFNILNKYAKHLKKKQGIIKRASFADQIT
jgi:hypothetical protein